MTGIQVGMLCEFLRADTQMRTPLMPSGRPLRSVVGVKPLRLVMVSLSWTHAIPSRSMETVPAPRRMHTNVNATMSTNWRSHQEVDGSTCSSSMSSLSPRSAIFVAMCGCPKTKREFETP